MTSDCAPLPLPRLTASQLADRSSVHAEHPFILLADNASAASGWTRSRLSTTFWASLLSSSWPEATAEFWLHGPSPSNPFPEIQRMATAARQLASQPHAYLLVQLPPQRWRRLARFSDAAVSPPSRVSWSCLGSARLEAEWHLKSHWSQLLAGRTGAGMANHTDSLRAGAWHLQLAGRKRWRLSAYSGADGSPREVVYEAVLNPGEQLFYPPDWAHETQCLDAPTVSVTESIVPRAARRFYEQVQADCASQSHASLHLSGELCDAWERCKSAIIGSESDGEAAELPSWRERIRRVATSPMAAQRLVSEREAILPEHACNDVQGLSQ